jgi:hypothetical protein
MRIRLFNKNRQGKKRFFHGAVIRRYFLRYVEILRERAGKIRIPGSFMFTKQIYINNYYQLNFIVDLFMRAMFCSNVLQKQKLLYLSCIEVIQ